MNLRSFIETHSPTTTGVVTAAGPIMLGACIAIVIAGCQSPSRDLSPTSMSPAFVGPVEDSQTHDAGGAAKTTEPTAVRAEPEPSMRDAAVEDEPPAVTAAREELGDEAAEAVREAMPEPSPPKPIDPGAAAIVELIDRRLPDDRPVDGNGRTRIGLELMRNQSKCSGSEYQSFVQRLADLLTAAGSDHSLAFTAEATEPVHYQRLGSSYLNTVSGFDQWELYLRLSPADRAWTLWEPNAPVLVLRQPQPSRPQITRWPTGDR